MPVRTEAFAAVANPAGHTVEVYYVIPSDMPFEQAIFDRIVETTSDGHSWYQCASGGVTWDLAFPEVVRVYYGQKTRQEYVDGGYYGPILTEMGANGVPVFTPGSTVALWARGAGWFAGANPGCDGECGVAMVGVELFSEFNSSELSGGTCPSGTGVAAWPCTPGGAFAHELGHALAALPHPYDIDETRDVAFHSIMQTHWNYPSFAPESDRPWGFLTVERQQLLASPFLKREIELEQTHDCDVVNLPVVGAVPTARFRLRAADRTISLVNQSRHATLYYWTFGDGTVSNAEGKRVVHTYANPGTYTVTLRASSAAGMTAIARRQITVPVRPR